MMSRFRSGRQEALGTGGKNLHGRLHRQPFYSRPSTSAAPLAPEPEARRSPSWLRGLISGAGKLISMVLDSLDSEGSISSSSECSSDNSSEEEYDPVPEKEMFEREWEMLDGRKVALEAEVKRLSAEREKFEMWKHSEEERLKNEGLMARTSLQRDLEDLRLKKEAFEKMIAQERADNQVHLDSGDGMSGEPDRLNKTRDAVDISKLMIEELQKRQTSALLPAPGDKRYNFRHSTMNKTAYDGAVATLPGKEQWVAPTEAPTIIAPRVIRLRGRPQKRSLKSFLENNTKSGRSSHKCGRCGECGHNRRTCKNPIGQSSQGS